MYIVSTIFLLTKMFLVLVNNNKLGIAHPKCKNYVIPNLYDFLLLNTNVLENISAVFVIQIPDSKQIQFLFFGWTTTSLERPLYSGWCMKMVKLENRQNALTFYLFIVALEHISCLAVVVINVCSVVLQITLGCENEQSRLVKEGLRLSRQQMKDDL